MNTRTLALGLMLAQMTLGASAGPITFDDRNDFENQGTIAEFQDFESFAPGIFTSPGDPFVDGSVTYTSPGENLIVGADTFINPLSNTMSYEEIGTSLTADLAGNFTMFALDMAINNQGNVLADVTLTIFTNVSAYLFDFTLPEVQDAQLFQGFVLTGNEFFTGFEFSALDFVHIDNVTLGTTVAVPEPPVLLLVMAGTLLMRVVRRRRR
ncbi:MAG: PEP-CTERM sorting domain-containing protein [Gammaproteobacteria bacterium]